MNVVGSMVKRNCRIFFRDRSAVFFSCFSALIVLGLTVLFLGQTYTDSMLHVMERMKGAVTETDRTHVEGMILLWTAAGILSVNAVTVSFTALSAMVRDGEAGRLNAFFVSPVKRVFLNLGYIIAAWIISMTMSLVTGGVVLGIMALKGLTMPGWDVMLKILGVLGISSFCFASIGYVFALLTKSSSAWSGLLTVIGTLVGFAAGCYLPVGDLSEGVQKVLKCLPILHSAAAIRELLAGGSLVTAFDGAPAEVLTGVKEELGFTLGMGEHVFSLGENLMLIGIYGAAAIVMATVLSRRWTASDR